MGLVKAIVAGTGHRPDKLGGYSEIADKKLYNLAFKALVSFHPDYTTLITGMALGWDTALAKAAFELRIPFLAYVPFKGQESKWPPESQRIYFELLQKATEIKYCCDPGYAAWKMQKRNEMMVDDCDTVLACWDGSQGGTYNCIKYAEKKQKIILNYYSDL